MKTKEHLESFKSAKGIIRSFAKQIMISRMVYDNIQDIVPKGWEATMKGWGTEIDIVPIENNNVTADIFDKAVSKFAKAFCREPIINITEDYMTAIFYIYPAFNHKDYKFRWDSTNITFKVGNTEKCEITYKRKMTKVRQLTGYCKAISEKKYLETVNKS